MKLSISRAILAVTVCVAASAHPMGNFSVNHYARITPSQKGVELEYVLDLAELPTLDLFQTWNVTRDSPPAVLQRHAAQQAREWLQGLSIGAGRKRIVPELERATVVVADGAGNLPIVRITAFAHLDVEPGTLVYEDRNYPERAGWKEIVIGSSAGTTLQRASQSSHDISHALTQYPPDPTLAPPQDLRAELTWTAATPKLVPAAPVISHIEQPRVAPVATAPALTTGKSAPAGSVVRGDFLSTLLHKRELTLWMILAALGAAFLLGAAHAFTPGHGKTIVAAYLVGSRGTLKHAAFLGAMVTFTHTVAVFLLGLATLFLFRYVVPEKITVFLGALSGLSIVAVGAWMLWKRLRRKGHSDAHHHHHHGHEHAHRHDDQGHHHHEHPGHHHDHHHHDQGHGHAHAHSHSHVPENISWGALATLGISGGLVPCESALILLLGAIAIGRVGLGLLLLVGFSLGLALVLIGIGILVLYAKNLIPERKRNSAHPVWRWAAIASPALVIVVGLLMTAVSLGLVQPAWAI